MKRRLTLMTLALLAALTLAACGASNDETGAAPPVAFNDADVTFAQAMIPHHQQAVQMANMAKVNASTDEVHDLAVKIEAAQQPEINLMTAWLKTWNRPAPSGQGMNHDMGKMGADDMPGMMSDDDLKGLNQAKGAAFDRMFLTMMIQHHEGAIEMAKTEQADGKDPGAIKLAKQIQTAQTAEITTMYKLLDALPAT